MARTASVNYTAPGFPKADAPEDAFQHPDIQQLAAAVDFHDHTDGKGLPVAALVADGSITSSQIADGTIQTVDLGDAQVTSGKLAAGAAATNVGALGGGLSGTLPNPTLAANSVGNLQLAGNAVTTDKIADGTVASGDLAAGAAATNVGPLGGVLTGALPNPSLANNAVQTVHIADGQVTSAKIADGTITTAKLADRSVTNVKLASDTARANLLTNGGFEIWQRGNGPFTTNAAYMADRWYIVLGAGSTMSVSRNTANVDTASQYCAAVTYTHAAQSELQQPIIGTDINGFKGRVVSLSLRVWAPAPNTVRLRANPGSGAQTSAFNSGSGQYETVSLTIGPVTGTNFNYIIEFHASGTYYIDNAMLVVGNVAADYAPLHPADDLARCLRYYETLGVPGSGSLYFETWASGAGQTFTWPLLFKTTKAVTPSVTNTGTWSVTNCTVSLPVGADVTTSAIRLTSAAAGSVTARNMNTVSIIFEANP